MRYLVMENNRTDSVGGLLNLGPRSSGWLEAVGIETRADLERVGANQAYEMVREAGFESSKNLLYALIGAIEEIPWREVARRMRES